MYAIRMNGAVIGLGTAEALAWSDAEREADAASLDAAWRSESECAEIDTDSREYRESAAGRDVA